MRKKIFVGLLLLIFLVGCSTKASLTPEMEVREFLHSYLTALEDHDTTTLVKLSDDLRFPDKKVQLEHYLEIPPTITHTEIIDLTYVSPTEFETTLSVTDDGEQLELTFPVKRTKNKWKIIVGQDH